MAGVKIGFIGAGKMATALARGIVSQGKMLKSLQDLSASCPQADAELLKPIKELGGFTLHDNKELVTKSNVIIIAVKPLILPKVLHEIKPVLTDSKIIVSIAAGIKIHQMEEYLGSDIKAKVTFQLLHNQHHAESYI